MIKRDRYLHELIRSTENGKIKVITGIRRCGKTVLLENFQRYLVFRGVPASHIIELPLGSERNARYRNPMELGIYLRNQLIDAEHTYFIFLDDIHRVETVPNPYLPESGKTIGLADVLLGLTEIKNVDLYVTCSNALPLSQDIPAELRAHTEEIRIYPLSFAEFSEIHRGGKLSALQEYIACGGLPQVQQAQEDKPACLRSLLDEVYLKDVLSRHRVSHGKAALEDILRILAASAGLLTSPSKISEQYAAERGSAADSRTVAAYMDYFIDTFLLCKVQRYDIKSGVKYIGSPLKYFFADTGLRNACLGFGQQEDTGVLKNLIFNELLFRGCEADVGMVSYNCRDQAGKRQRVHLEVDFVANRGGSRYFIQYADALPGDASRAKIINPLLRISEPAQKIVIVRDAVSPFHDETGILHLGLEQFLLDEDAMDS